MYKTEKEKINLQQRSKLNWAVPILLSAAISLAEKMWFIGIRGLCCTHDLSRTAAAFGRLHSSAGGIAVAAVRRWGDLKPCSALPGLQA